jgi:hypothetical protein
MLRLVLLPTLVMVALLLIAGLSTASECPVLINAIYEATANRFDSNAYDARQKAAQAAKLHAEGKHRDAELIARQGIELLTKKE